MLLVQLPAYVDDELELIIAESAVAFWTFILTTCSRLITDPVAFAAVSGNLVRLDPKQPGLQLSTSQILGEGMTDSRATQLTL